MVEEVAVDVEKKQNLISMLQQRNVDLAKTSETLAAERRAQVSQHFISSLLCDAPQSHAISPGYADRTARGRQGQAPSAAYSAGSIAGPACPGRRAAVAGNCRTVASDRAPSHEYAD